MAQVKKKLPHALRQEQLLEVAMGIVREHGAEALKLGYVAERAGVSKPVVYDHFGSRGGLLIALYKAIDQQQVTELKRVLEQPPSTLEQTAKLLSESYMRCYASAGPEWHSVAAALRAHGKLNAIHQELLDGYVQIYYDALAPYACQAVDALHLSCVGIIGAAEAISREMLMENVSSEEAATTMSAIIMGAMVMHQG